MNSRNYQKECENLLKGLDGKKKLLLHCCCAPCSSYTLEFLHPYFDITLYFYNPNITEQEEYEKRKKELIRFIHEYPFPNPIHTMEAPYNPEEFLEMAKGKEEIPEGGERCFHCYEMRLRKAAMAAKEIGADYFCTTLSISPYKNARKLMEIGERLGQVYGLAYLPSDFKKKDGYKKSILLSKEYDLYRQDYCGCVYSRIQRERENEEKRH
jgi:predicted adenine nucleotide alpha hydrolase (AANH) superfamily ATPase